LRPDRHDDQLNEAVDALIEGASRDEVAALLPDDLGPLVEAADVLARSAQAGANGPRPSFVLGLEEQLRTDLRLRRPGLPRASLRNRFLRWVAALVVATMVMLVVVEQSNPDDLLYGVKQTIEESRVRLMGSAGTRVDQYLDSAWRLLADIRDMHESPSAEMTAAAWNAALDDLVEAYSSAANEAVVAGDPKLQRRVRSETDMAARELTRIAGEAERGGLERARLFRVSASALRRSIAALPSEAGDAWRAVGAAAAPATPPEASVTPSPRQPTPRATEQSTARPTERATEISTLPAVLPTAGSPTIAVTMIATAPPATARPALSTSVPTSVPATQAVRPPHTPVPVTPTDTPAPPIDTPGSSVIATGTSTPDEWVTTSTPELDRPTPTTGTVPGTPAALPTLHDPGTSEPTSQPSSTPGSSGADAAPPE
jgi:hypothetical protein